MSNAYPDITQTGQVITDGPESPEQDPGIPVAGNYDDPSVYSTYNVVVSTRPFRMDTDGWNFQASQTTIQVKRSKFQVV